MKRIVSFLASSFERSMATRLFFVILAASYGVAGAWSLGIAWFVFGWNPWPSADDLWFRPGEFTGDELPFHLASYALIVCLVHGVYRVLFTPERSDNGHWMTVISVPPMLLFLSDVSLLGSKGPQLCVWAGFGILVAGGYCALRWIGTWCMGFPAAGRLEMDSHQSLRTGVESSLYR